MGVRDLIPWKREEKGVGLNQGQNDPILSIRNEMDRLFDKFIVDPFGAWPSNRSEAAFMPNVDVFETDQEIKVIAEVPGIDEKDIDVSLSEDLLTIRGKKENQIEEKKGQFHRVERSFGSFRRDVALPSTVDYAKTEATFKKGILTITLPKLETATGLVRKIKITQK